MALFSGLDERESRLSEQRYLFGVQITEADVRLWVTLIKRHYYMTHPQLNPTRIVHAGPLLDGSASAGRRRVLRRATAGGWRPARGRKMAS